MLAHKKLLEKMKFDWPREIGQAKEITKKTNRVATGGIGDRTEKSTSSNKDETKRHLLLRKAKHPKNGLNITYENII